MKNLYLCVIFLTVASVRCRESVPHKVCSGTYQGLYTPFNEKHHYKNLRRIYTNCTFVNSNLEITSLRNSQFDLSFLENIREVTGYVLISQIDHPKIVLPRLQIIHGKTLYKSRHYNNKFALFVYNSKINSLEMPALIDISNGSIGFYTSFDLCHLQTINWDEIASGVRSNYTKVNVTWPFLRCPSCDKSCEKGCWGEGPHNCQRFSRVNCSPLCWQNRCFGPNKSDCCHPTCAAGCTGPKSSDCIACKNFDDNGVCVDQCSGTPKYNPSNQLWESNLNGTFAFGIKCVKKCPEYLVKDNGACVKECSPGKKEQNGECVDCKDHCPRICRGGDVTSANIDSFKGCTTIHGPLKIGDLIFRGYAQFGPAFNSGPLDAIHPDRLEVFSAVKEITGSLYITMYHPDFKNLTYFRNLEIIRGRTLGPYSSSVYIDSTSLASVELPSLKEISHGAVYVVYNGDLCDARDEYWKKIMKSSEYQIDISHNKCDDCDKKCYPKGCWGPGPDKCL